MESRERIRTKAEKRRQKSSVMDPWLFYMDPDPYTDLRIRILIFSWLTRWQQPTIFFKHSFAFYFLKVHLHQPCEDNAKKVRKKWKSRFFLQINAYWWKDPGGPKTWDPTESEPQHCQKENGMLEGGQNTEKARINKRKRHKRERWVWRKRENMICDAALNMK